VLGASLLPDAADVWWLRRQETWVVTVDGTAARIRGQC